MMSNYNAAAMPETSLTPLSYSRRLWLLLLTLIFTLSISSMITSAIGVDTRAKILLGSTIQNLLVFAGSAFIVAVFVSKKPTAFLGVSEKFSPKSILGVVGLMAVSMPMLNWIINWNQELHLPAAMGGLEQTLRQMEEMASATSEVLLSTTSVGGLISGVLVVGVLTGICEELFFRGATQRVIASSGMNPHAAIWIAAFIFSTLHFQFFGFVPRLLLGAGFGYLFYWTGSIWVSATAHAINNSIVVVCTWLANRGADTTAFEQLGLQNGSFPWLPIISLIFVALFFRFHKFFFSRNK